MHTELGFKEDVEVKVVSSYFSIIMTSYFDEINLRMYKFIFGS